MTFAGNESAGTPNVQKPRILILSLPHGAGHQRAAEALRKALEEIQPDAVVEVADALAYCARWFRRYYSSYEIPLKYWPSLWGWIEALQYKSTSTGPNWLYRRGGQPLFRFIETRDPDVLVVTEVGLCELAALLKRETQARFHLIGVCLMDLERAWARPEVDLYPIAPGELAARLEAIGVPRAKILPCGTPIDLSFAAPQDRAAVRARLGVEPHTPLLLIPFGGTGHGKPRPILVELGKVRQPFEAVFIAGRNPRLEKELRHRCRGRPHTRVLGWVDNMHEWMAAADLLLSKPAGMTLFEAINSALPFLAFDPLPGNEKRNCLLIEQWGVGYWVRRSEDLAPALERLLRDPAELERLRRNTQPLQRPRAAYEAAQAILKLLGPHSST